MIHCVTQCAAFANRALGCRILSGYAAYAEEPFAQMWSDDRQRLLIGKLDGDLTLAVKETPTRRNMQELRTFFSVIGGSTLLTTLPPDVFAVRDFSLASHGGLYKFSEAGECPPILPVRPTVREAFAVLRECFPDFGSDAQYVDCSHRIRHRFSRIYGTRMNGQWVSVGLTVETDKSAVLSGICSLPSARGTGAATHTVQMLCHALRTEQKSIYLLTEERTAGFYTRMGFVRIDDWFQYNK